MSFFFQNCNQLPKRIILLLKEIAFNLWNLDSVLLNYFLLYKNINFHFILPCLFFIDTDEKVKEKVNNEIEIVTRFEWKLTWKKRSWKHMHSHSFHLPYHFIFIQKKKKCNFRSPTWKSNFRELEALRNCILKYISAHKIWHYLHLFL